MAKAAESVELEVSETQTVSRSSKKDFIFATGRRREAVARVRLYAGKNSVTWNGIEAKKGEIMVNGQMADVYFSGAVAKALYTEPLNAVNALNKYIVTIRVVGGGKNGQLGAVVHGIARALQTLDEKHRPTLKKRGFLTRDARVRQRRSIGMGGKSRRQKQSPKR